jgi:hypothetical protein
VLREHSQTHLTDTANVIYSYQLDRC